MASAASQALGKSRIKFGSSGSSASSEGISDEIGKWMDSAFALSPALSLLHCVQACTKVSSHLLSLVTSVYYVKNGNRRSFLINAVFIVI